MVKHIKGACEGLHDGCQTSLISNRLDYVVIIIRGKAARTLPPPNTSLVLRVPSLPPPGDNSGPC